MSKVIKKSAKDKLKSLDTAEAFYRVFCALPKKDRLAVARYIFEDEEIRQNFNLSEIPNEITLEAFSEEKSNMPILNSIDELREDLLS